jgi:hypothetical protein
MLVELAPFTDGPLTNLTGIDRRALHCWEQEWRPATRQDQPWSEWDWRAGVQRWTRCIDRFEVAIWSGEQLCGLAIGKPSDRRQNLSIYAVQGSPVENHPLRGKVLPIVIDVAGAYGTALGCKELRFVNPLPGMIRVYERLGFELETRTVVAPYCVRPL